MTRKVTTITTQDEHLGMTDFWREVEQVGQSKISITKGGVQHQVTAKEAVLQRLAQSALQGSPQSIRQFNALVEAASERRQNEIDNEVAGWTRIKAYQTKVYADYRAAHDGQEPFDFPHPDDIEISPGKGVKINGPLNQGEYEKVCDTLNFIDACLWQEAQESAYAGYSIENDGKPASALLLAEFLNSGLPIRLQLTELDILMRRMRREGMSKRVLLKETYAAWRRAKISMPRGKTFIALTQMIQMLEMISGGIKVMTTDGLSKAQKEQHIDELVHDRFG